MVNNTQILQFYFSNIRQNILFIFFKYVYDIKLIIKNTIKRMTWGTIFPLPKYIFFNKFDLLCIGQNIFD